MSLALVRAEEIGLEKKIYRKQTSVGQKSEQPNSLAGADGSAPASKPQVGGLILTQGKCIYEPYIYFRN